MPESRSLYSLSTEYAALAKKLAETDLDEQTIKDTLEGEAYHIEVKAASCAAVYLQMEAIHVGMKDRIAKMVERAKHIDNRMRALKSYMERSLSAAGITKVEHPDFRIVVRNNPEHVVIDSTNLVPSEYLRIPDPPPPELDKAKIKQAIKAGTEVPGAHLEQTRRVEID